MAYWNLRPAIEQIEIQRRALELARRSLAGQPDRGRDRHAGADRHGAVRSAGRQRRAGLLDAADSLADGGADLKRLLASAARTTTSTRRRSTRSTGPRLRVQSVDIPGGRADGAGEQRTDLVHRSARTSRSAQLNLEVTEDQTLPELDLSARLQQLSGQGGTQLSTTASSRDEAATAMRCAARHVRHVRPGTSEFNVHLPARHAGGQVRLRAGAACRSTSRRRSSRRRNCGLGRGHQRRPTSRTPTSSIRRRARRARRSRAQRRGRADALRHRHADQLRGRPGQNSLTSARLSELSRAHQLHQRGRRVRARPAHRRQCGGGSADGQVAAVDA